MSKEYEIIEATGEMYKCNDHYPRHIRTQHRMGCKRDRLWRIEHHIQRKDGQMAKRHRIYVGRVLPSGSRKVACGYGKELKMTRQEMINKLEEIIEDVDWDSDGELTDYAREKAYICIQQAIKHLQINYEE